LAAAGYARAGKLDTRTVAMIRIDAMWLAAGCWTTWTTAWASRADR